MIAGWKQTHTGRAVYPVIPNAADVVLEDIAHALAQEVRYGGHAPFPYSVAQHSVYVSLRVEELSRARGDNAAFVRELAKAALLHDAHEAYLKDIVAPVKPYLHVALRGEAVPWRELERRWDYAISEALQVAAPMNHGLVKQADLELLATEAAQFFPVAGRPQEWQPLPAPLPGFVITEWWWGMTKGMFLDRWAELGGEL